MIKLVIFALITGLSFGASADGMGSSSKYKSDKEASAKLGASTSSEITFEKGQSNLSEAAKQEIRNVVEKSKASGKKIDEVKAAVWSDREYPTQGQASNVPKADIDLAKKREKAIKDFIAKDLDLDVETFNMSERPNALQKFMGTETADVKKTLEARGSAPASDETGMLDHDAKASKAVIMVFTE